MSDFQTRRFTKHEKLNELLARSGRILQMEDRILALEQREQDALQAVSDELATIGADVDTAAKDVKSILQARDNIIADLQSRLATANAQLGVNANTIAADEAMIQQQKDAATAASDQVVAGLSGIADSLKATDARVKAVAPAQAVAVPDAGTPPVIGTPPVVVAPPDTGTPPDTGAPIVGPA